MSISALVCVLNGEHMNMRTSKNQQLNQLYQLSVRLGTTLDLVYESSTFMNWLVEAVQPSLVALFLADESKQELQLVHAHGFVLPTDHCLPLGVDLWRWLEGHGACVPEEGNPRRYAIPIPVETQLFGTLCLISTSSTRRLAEEQQLLSTAAGYLAPVLRNIWRYGGLEQQVITRTAALVQAEARYRGLFEGVPIGLIRTTPDGQILDANSTLVRMLGYPDRESLLAVNVARLCVKPETQRLWQIRLEHNESMHDYLWQVSRYDGTIIWGRSNFQVVRNDAGEVLYYNGFFEDITDHKQIEEALQKSQKDYRDLFENASDIIICSTQDGTVTDVNHAAEELWGRPRTEIIGQSFHKLVTPSSAAPGEDRIRLLLAGEKASSSVELEFASKDGGIMPFDGRINTLADASGKILGFQGIFRESSVLKKTRQALAESQRFIERVVETMPGVLYVYDMVEQRNVYVNRQIGNLLGYTVEDVQRMGSALLRTLLHPNDFNRFPFYSERMDAAQKGDVGEFEYRMQHANGEWRWVYDRETVFSRTADGSPKQILGIMQDITERKQIEKAFQESEKLAATGRMAARVAHEINNPLAGIKNSFLLIKDVVPQDHCSYEYVGRIEKEISRIARIVRQMLDLYRTEREVVYPFRIDETISDVVALLEANCRQYGVTLSIEESTTPLRMLLPETSVRQILFNLLTNAIEASLRGGVVKVATKATERDLILTVSDQGIGISEDVRTRIFEPFFTTKNEHPGVGLGLGLSISRSLIEAMKGTLSFQSQLGQGTVFKVILPLSRSLKGDVV